MKNSPGRSQIFRQRLASSLALWAVVLAALFGFPSGRRQPCLSFDSILFRSFRHPRIRQPAFQNRNASFPGANSYRWLGTFAFVRVARLESLCIALLSPPSKSGDLDSHVAPALATVIPNYGRASRSLSSLCPPVCLVGSMSSGFSLFWPRFTTIPQ